MKAKEIKITVATVTWNPGSLLERTLNSVEEQTHPLVQHVIVDGRSSDQTLTTIRQYQERNGIDSRPAHEITLLSEPDHGLYDAMNKALLLATGDYIVFLNAGDKFHSPDTLALVAKTAAKAVDADFISPRTDNAGADFISPHTDNVGADLISPRTDNVGADFISARNNTQPRAGIKPAPTGHSEASLEGHRLLPAVVYGHTDIVDDSGHFLRPRHLAPPEDLTWHSFKDGMLVCHQAFYARTDIAKRTPYNLHYRFSADYDWCIRILQEGTRLSLPNANTHAVLADYLEGGMTVKNHRRSLLERYRVMAAHYGSSTAFTQHLSFIFRALKRKL